MPRSRIAPALRAAALLVAGALALHELRYLVDAGAESTAWAAGHSYLSVAGPLLAVLASAVAAGSVLAGALSRDSRPRRHPALSDRAAGLAISLLAVHLVQEGAEALLSGAGPAAVVLSLAAACAYAIPLAALIGLAFAALGRLLDGAELALAGTLAAIRIAREAPSAPADETCSTPTRITRPRATAPRAPPSSASA